MKIHRTFSVIKDLAIIHDLLSEIHQQTMFQILHSIKIKHINLYKHLHLHPALKNRKLRTIIYKHRQLAMQQPFRIDCPIHRHQHLSNQVAPIKMKKKNQLLQYHRQTDRYYQRNLTQHYEIPRQSLLIVMIQIHHYIH